jgi:hypothetical protein
MLIQAKSLHSALLKELQEWNARLLSPILQRTSSDKLPRHCPEHPSFQVRCPSNCSADIAQCADDYSWQNVSILAYVEGYRSLFTSKLYIFKRFTLLV